nr:hypothetical protein [Yoonia vestfoldensis]
MKSDALLEMARNFVNDGEIRVYIDDIDRGWTGTKVDIENISALLNACRDLANEDRRLKFRIGLRADAYYLFRTTDASGDKVAGSVIRLDWDNHQILAVMAKRVANYMGDNVDIDELVRQPQLEISRHLYPVLTERFEAVGKWSNKPIHNVLLSFVRRRPRDMITLLKTSAVQARKNKHQKILTPDIQEILPSYSESCISDLVIEFSAELEQVEALLTNMRPTKKEMGKPGLKSVYDKGELLSKIKNIQQSKNFSFTNRDPVTPQSLANFLYKIDFIIARKEGSDGKIDRKYFDQNRMLQSQFVDFGYSWEIHPAYRWALQPYDAKSVLEQIDALMD